MSNQRGFRQRGINTGRLVGVRGSRHAVRDLRRLRIFPASRSADPLGRHCLFGEHSRLYRRQLQVAWNAVCNVWSIEHRRRLWRSENRPKVGLVHPIVVPRLPCHGHRLHVARPRVVTNSHRIGRRAVAGFPLDILKARALSVTLQDAHERKGLRRSEPHERTSASSGVRCSTVRCSTVCGRLPIGFQKRNDVVFLRAGLCALGEQTCT